MSHVPSSSSPLKPALVLSPMSELSFSDSQPSMLSLRIVPGLIASPDSFNWGCGDNGGALLTNSVISAPKSLAQKFGFFPTLSKLNLLLTLSFARGLIALFFSAEPLPFRLHSCKSLDDCERPTGGGRLMEEGPNEPGLRPPRSTLRSCWSCRDRQKISYVNVRILFIGFYTFSLEEDERSCLNIKTMCLCDHLIDSCVPFGPGESGGWCLVDYDWYKQEKLCSYSSVCWGRGFKGGWRAGGEGLLKEFKVLKVDTHRKVISISVAVSVEIRKSYS